jgi:hypothetical protein
LFIKQWRCPFQSDPNSARCDKEYHTRENLKNHFEKHGSGQQLEALPKGRPPMQHDITRQQRYARDNKPKINAAKQVQRQKGTLILLPFC